MPRLTTGSVFSTGDGYGIRWPEGGRRPQHTGFKTKTEARRWFAANVAPRLDRGESGIVPELTLAEFVDLFLERHAGTVRPKDHRRAALASERCHRDVRERAAARPATDERGDRRPGRRSSRQRSRFGIVAALRQALGAAVRWGYMTPEPGGAGRAQ